MYVPDHGVGLEQIRPAGSCRKWGDIQQSSNASNINYKATSTRDHVWSDRLSHTQDGVDVGLEDLLDVFEGNFQ